MRRFKLSGIEKRFDPKTKRVCFHRRYYDTHLTKMVWVPSHEVLGDKK